MKKLGLLFLVIMGLSELQAQQDPMYSQYMFNTLSVNPGYAGSRDLLTVTAIAREQWVGVNGRPRTQSLTMHMPVSYRTLGVGISVLNDNVGPINNTAAYVDVAYRNKVSINSWLAFGLKGGINIIQGDIMNLQREVQDDLAYYQNFSNKILPNVGFGAYYYGPRFYVGVSTPRLLENNLNVNKIEDAEVAVARERRHYFLIAGAVLNMNSYLKFKPTFLTKVVEDGSVGLDLTASVLIQDKVSAGLMYRLEDAVGILLQYQFTDQLRAGYAYDYPISRLTNYTHGSHELMISYDFNYLRDKIMSPRYF